MISSAFSRRDVHGHQDSPWQRGVESLAREPELLMPMLSSALCLLLALQIPFPRPNPAAGAGRGEDQSWIAGQVRTQGGDPVPLATVSVRPNPDASRADQRGTAAGWPGTVIRVKADGSFRLAVPGGTTYEVCAMVPAKTKQCRTLDVNSNDLADVEFSI